MRASFSILPACRRPMEPSVKIILDDEVRRFALPPRPSFVELHQQVVARFGLAERVRLRYKVPLARIAACVLPVCGFERRMPRAPVVLTSTTPACACEGRRVGDVHDRDGTPAFRSL
jgi:hypothetical protein